MNESSYQRRCRNIARVISLIVALISSALFVYLFFEEWDNWWFLGLLLLLYIVVLGHLTDNKEKQASDELDNQEGQQGQDNQQQNLLQDKDQSFWGMMLLAIGFSIGYAALIASLAFMFGYMIGDDETEGLFSFVFLFALYPIFVIQVAWIAYQTLIRRIESGNDS